MNEGNRWMEKYESWRILVCSWSKACVTKSTSSPTEFVPTEFPSIQHVTFCCLSSSNLYEMCLKIIFPIYPLAGRIKCIAVGMRVSANERLPLICSHLCFSWARALLPFIAFFPFELFRSFHSTPFWFAISFRYKTKKFPICLWTE